MRRIYFLVHDLPTAHRIIDELLVERVPEKHLHVIARRGTPLQDLPEASVLQKTDFIHAVERGIAMGGAAGILGGLIAVAIPPGMTVIAGGILLASALSGAGVGAWLGGMVGMNVGNTKLKRFESAIEAGQLLILVDVPRERVEEIEERVKQHLPEVDIEGTEPTTPAFP